MLNYTTVEELKQVPIEDVKEELNASKIMYEYLGDPKDHIDYFNEEDYAILQQKLAELQK